MNSAEAFLREGILVDPDISEDLREIKFSLVNIVKGLNIDFFSKQNLKDNYYRIKLSLETLKQRKSPEEKIKIDDALNYLNKYASNLPPVKAASPSKDKIEKKSQKKSNIDRKVKVLECPKIIPKDLNVQDFVKFYKSRYEVLKNILKTHTELSNLTLINKLSQNNRDIAVIGLVYSKRVTKNNHILLDIEDLTGRTKVLVNVNKPDILEKAKEIVLDEVVGFKCSGNSEILFANDVIFPDIDSLSGRKNRLEEEEYAAFTSDTHIGSNVFLGDKFQKFIDWINGKTGTPDQKEQTKKIKYLFITGDLVDGVGHFSGQESHLAITDYKSQYDKIYGYLSQIRKEITIIICPGQHDASYVAEPQPPISEFAEDLIEMENVISVSNPSLIEIGAKPGKPGVKVLMFHGASLHITRDDIEELRLGDSKKHPTKIMKYFLKKRHLGPPHTTNTHLPIPEGDPLVIREVPDILVTGDMHRSDVSSYKGVMMINSSCWQPLTPFEAKVGNIPDPCKVPLVNLKTWEVKILDFN